MTITDSDIRSFLARVGDAAPPAPSFDQLQRTRNHAVTERVRSARPVAIVAAAIMLVVGVVGVAVVNIGGDASEPPVASLPADPPGPLFVLPVDLATHPVRGGYVSVWDPAGQPPDGVYRWVALGTPVGDGFEHLVGATVLGPDAHVDELLSLGEWDELDTENSPTYVQNRGAGLTIVQQRNDSFVRLTSSSVTQDELTQLLSDLEISDAGDILATSDLYTVIASGTENAATVYGASFTLSASEGSFFVETAGLSNPLANIGIVGDRAEPITFGTRQGWLISQDTPDGPSPYAVAWSATQRRIIAVSTNSDRAVDTTELVDIADQLTIVDESTWRTALPDATTQTEPTE